MSNRNRIEQLALALIAAGVFVFMFAVAFAIISEQYAKVHQIYSRYQQAADAERRKIAEEASRACIEVAPALLVKCVADQIVDYNKKQSTNQDLQAQQDMALWAFMSFIAACCGVVVTGAGLYFVRETLEANRRAVNAAEKAITVENRPWIMIEVPEPITGFGVSKSGGQIQFSVPVRNLGNGPARRVWVWAGELDFDSPDIFRDAEKWIAEQVSAYASGEVDDEVIFPREQARHPVIGSMSRFAIERQYGATKSINPCFIFGVFYQSAIDGKILYTAVGYAFGTKNYLGGPRGMQIGETWLEQALANDQLNTAIDRSHIVISRYSGLSRAT